MKPIYIFFIIVGLFLIGLGQYISRKEQPEQLSELGIYRMVMVFQDTVLKIGVITYEQYDQEPYLYNGQVILCYPDIGEVVVAYDVYSFKTIKQ